MTRAGAWYSQSAGSARQPTRSTPWDSACARPSAATTGSLCTTRGAADCRERGRDRSGARRVHTPGRHSRGDGRFRCVDYIHVDHLNTPRLVANQAGAAVWRWDQREPFGLIPPNENPSGLGVLHFNLRFPGQYFDRETITHYNGFRDYAPGIGRYAESDLIGLRGGLNTYAYVNANPIIFKDLLGLEVGDLRQRDR